ncbi:hypothetical protein BDQ17DRAFT_1331210 [Cyathus striatus]|nr:hypothetical protein BDQ17DRAFT_1331210 [Cyathus striatus]
MFDTARNFVIQNGVFIDVSGNAKLYAKRFFPKSSHGPQYTDKLESSTNKLDSGNAHLLLNMKSMVISWSNFQGKPRKEQHGSIEGEADTLNTSKIWGIYRISPTHPSCCLQYQIYVRLYSTFIDRSYSDVPGAYSESLEDCTPLYDSTGFIDFYVNSHGNLNAVLSVGSLGVNDHNNNNYHQRQFKYLLGHPVIVWPGPMPTNSDCIHDISGQFGSILQNFTSSSWLCRFNFSNLFYLEPSRVHQFMCFELKTNSITAAIFRNADNQNISFSKHYSISVDTYHNWLYQVPQILENCAIIHDNDDFNLLGIVSGVLVTININIFLAPLAYYLQSNTDAEVYLFISNLIDPKNGKASEPHIY